MLWSCLVIIMLGIAFLKVCFHFVCVITLLVGTLLAAALVVVAVFYLWVLLSYFSAILLEWAGTVYVAIKIKPCYFCSVKTLACNGQ